MVNDTTSERPVDPESSPDHGSAMPFPGPMPTVSFARESARSFIKRRIGELRNRADRLQSLLDILPSKLPNDADSALWELAIGLRGVQ
jgi:hypothetical protein